MGYAYRVAEAADIPAMMTIRNGVRENALVSLVIGPDDYLRAMAEGKSWVCTDDGVVVGFASVRRQQRDVWALFVDAAHEGRGIGGALMDLAEAWMFEQGVDEIELTTAAGTRAERLYRRRGWKLEGYAPHGDARFTLRR
jgi:GNAT superfamily N-acetyltransferase